MSVPISARVKLSGRNLGRDIQAALEVQELAGHWKSSTWISSSARKPATLVLDGLPSRPLRRRTRTRLTANSARLSFGITTYAHASRHGFEDFRRTGNMPQCEQLIQSSGSIANAERAGITAIFMIVSIVVRTSLR
jgi:hypothetical protein